MRRNEPSIRFPSGLLLAATWNRDLAQDQGISMGRDARARGYFSILGPGMDFYRVPMGGRNFEYKTGEDPYLGAQLVPPLIMGIQAQGEWFCAKHYVCNDEEENRTNVQILLDERTLREIYLPPFEAAVKDGHVATVMSAYNAVNGPFCSEDPFLNTHPDDIPYSEGIFVGYRGYQKNHVHPLFLFGFGLSYTNFSFSDLDVAPAKFTGSGEVTASWSDLPRRTVISN